MTRRGCLRCAGLLFLPAFLSACGPVRVATPDRPGQDMLVLLPDPHTNHVGRASVSNAAGRVELADARAFTVVSPSAAPAPVTTMSEQDVSRLFGDALAALPPPPRHFTLFFRFESEELTDDSRRLLRDVLEAVRNQPTPDVLAIGHTDTTGQAAANLQLGLRRANAVRQTLIDSGLAASAIEVTSHGEGELLVPTADGVFEAKNRRVEITVR